MALPNPNANLRDDNSDVRYKFGVIAQNFDVVQDDGQVTRVTAIGGSLRVNGDPIGGGGGGGAVDSVNGDTGDVLITTSSIGALAVNGSGDVTIPGVLTLGAIEDVEAALAGGGGGSLPADATFESVIVSDSQNDTFIVKVVNTNAGSNRLTPPLLVEATGTGGIGVRTTGDTRSRVSLAADGEINFSNGSAAFDIAIKREAANHLNVQASNITLSGNTGVAGNLSLAFGKTFALANGEYGDLVIRPFFHDAHGKWYEYHDGAVFVNNDFAHGSNLKLGFYGKQPVVRPAAIADATDEASAVTAVNSALAALRAVGLLPA